MKRNRFTFAAAVTALGLSVAVPLAPAKDQEQVQTAPVVEVDRAKRIANPALKQPVTLERWRAGYPSLELWRSAGYSAILGCGNPHAPK